ncbi:MAG TPA: amidase, partial [Deltaproteobacteria bacterium]|nr:amidase [Deltaproteobacteria bacterium]
MTPEEYCDCDATDLAARVASGEVHPRELVEAAVSAIERVNPQLNAVVYRMYDAATEAAAGELPDGPLRGVPMVVKDFDGFVQGVPWTASSRFLEGFVPDHDSEAIARLRRAGLVFLAKTNLPELALVGTTEPQWRGPTRNPWSLEHSTGGSSGGSAALVASRAVPVGHGGDGGGSLRIPGSHCGLVGLKATRGRIPLGPDQGEGWGGYVQWGVLTRTVRDTAALLDVLSGPMPGDPYHAPPPQRPFREEVGVDPGKLRIAWTPDPLFGEITHPDCRAAAEATVAALEALGHHVTIARPDFDKATLVKAYLTQVAVGTAAEIDEFAALVGRAPRASSFEDTTWMLAQIGRAMTGLELQHARDAAQAAGRAMARFHQAYDLLVTPTVAHPPIRIGELALSRGQRLGLAALRAAPVRRVLRSLLDTLAEDNLERTPNTQLFNQTGQPAISLPMALSEEGLPVGVQLVAPMGGEATLIRVASQLEQAAPWA